MAAQDGRVFRSAIRAFFPEPCGRPAHLLQQDRREAQAAGACHFLGQFGVHEGGVDLLGAATVDQP